MARLSFFQVISLAYLTIFSSIAPIEPIIVDVFYGCVTGCMEKTSLIDHAIIFYLDFLFLVLEAFPQVWVLDPFNLREGDKTNITFIGKTFNNLQYLDLHTAAQYLGSHFWKIGTFSISLSGQVFRNRPWTSLYSELPGWIRWRRTEVVAGLVSQC